MKTSELTGRALDWAVAKCEGGTIRTENGVFLNQGDGYDYFTPSTYWAQGGPIIEREKLTLSDCGGGWAAGLCGTLNSFGPTALVAVCRCFIVSRLGGEVEVPEELCTPST